MGCCLSCIQARKKNNVDERQPLLEESIEDPQNEYDEADAQQRQQEISEVVNATHESFVDIANLNSDQGEADASSAQNNEQIKDEIYQHSTLVKLNVPRVSPISADDKKLLESSLQKFETK